MIARPTCMLMAAALVLAACTRGAGGGAGPDGGASSATGPGISIEQARTSGLEGPLLVNGWLWRADGGDIRLCTGLTESVPPRCVEPSLVVTGLDLSKVKGLRTDQGVTWSTQPTQVLGAVKNGVLTVDPLSSG